MRISSSRFAIIASVGVCTRPQDSCALYLHVNALVALIPTSQSASALETAAAYKSLYFLPSTSFANPSLIALSVTEEIQSLLIGLWQFAFSRIHLATSSPSRPASVAMMISPTSFRNICVFTALYCFAVFLMTTSSIFLGIIGSTCMFHSLNFLSYPSGSASVTRCPNAHVTIY